ncbi:Methyltransferase type 11 [Kalmanozyma brasiliensis GHG001]|uniref:Methyltransferase type 11 domain-containing protein n=1 Tax=Kalmanozyma brasiliensis (strain GHG001) TaxID=1365824 RepID=V5EFC7_KALBG|nr:Methyltransferase type 11 [Kalmanozyma brasiliensis GHG001]EST09191.1 Methyltransferase type 11 [Kalmanozyma brasiliensis GHG001]
MSDTATKSQTYTQGHSEAVLRSHASRTAEDSAAFLLPHLKRDAYILDVGCGPGTITTSFLKHIPNGRIVGVDTSADVIGSAAKRLSSLPESDLGSRCTFAIASAYDLPYPESTFDVVYCHQMLLHLPEPVRALREMRRVCKPDGLVAAREGDFSASIVYPSLPTTQLWLDTAGAVFRSIGAEPDGGRRLVRWALEAGYASEQVSFSSSNLGSGGPAAAQFWGHMWAERVAADEWKEKAVKTGLVTHNQVEQIREDWLKWSEREDAVFLTPCGEVLLRK